MNFLVCSLSLSCSYSFSLLALLSLISGSGGPEGVPRCLTKPVQSQNLSLPAHHGVASEDHRRAPGRPLLLEPGEAEEPQRQASCVCGY